MPVAEDKMRSFLPISVSFMHAYEVGVPSGARAVGERKDEELSLFEFLFADCSFRSGCIVPSCTNLFLIIF